MQCNADRRAPPSTTTQPRSRSAARNPIAPRRARMRARVCAIRGRCGRARARARSLGPSLLCSSAYRRRCVAARRRRTSGRVSQSRPRRCVQTENLPSTRAAHPIVGTGYARPRRPQPLRPLRRVQIVSPELAPVKPLQKRAQPLMGLTEPCDSVWSGHERPAAAVHAAERADERAEPAAVTHAVLRGQDGAGPARL